MHIHILYVLHNTLVGKLVGALINDKHLGFDVMSTRDLHFVNLFFL